MDGMNLLMYNLYIFIIFIHYSHSVTGNYNSSHCKYNKMKPGFVCTLPVLLDGTQSCFSISYTLNTCGRCHSAS